jgi:hypothetical protein
MEWFTGRETNKSNPDIFTDDDFRTLKRSANIGFTEFTTYTYDKHSDFPIRDKLDLALNPRGITIRKNSTQQKSIPNPVQLLKRAEYHDSEQPTLCRIQSCESNSPNSTAFSRDLRKWTKGIPKKSRMNQK